MTQSPTDLPTLRHKRSTPEAWIAFWGLVLFVLSILLTADAQGFSLDTYIWCTTRWAVGDGDYYHAADYHLAHAGDSQAEFYMLAPPPMQSQFYHRTRPFWIACKMGGEWYATAVAVIAITIAGQWKKRPLIAGAAVIGASVAGFLGWLIRSVDGRYRPTHIDGINRWSAFRGFYNGTDLSFPSGHATLVFATAAALSYIFPRMRPLWIALACLTAISRVVMEAHFWSDVILGSALGWTVGWLTMQVSDICLAKHTLQSRPGSPLTTNN